jgi:hypothetical protein
MNSFLMTCIEFFGKKPDQGNLEFGKEMQKLTVEDKREIYAGFQKLGIECLPPIEKTQ